MSIDNKILEEIQRYKNINQYITEQDVPPAEDPAAALPPPPDAGAALPPPPGAPAPEAGAAPPPDHRLRELNHNL